MDELNDLSKWIYYTGLFLSDFDRNINDEQNRTIRQKFLVENKFSPDCNFRLWNQGTMLMLLYGLLVIPKEFWARFLTDDGDSNKKADADELTFSSFKFLSRADFTDCDNIDSSGLKKAVFLRRLRNSVAHYGIEVIKDQEASKIKFSNKDNKGVTNLSVCISPKDLTEFLNEVGKFFIDECK